MAAKPQNRHGFKRVANRYVAACMLLAGCLGCGGDSRVAVHSVEGQILFNGKPVPKALVVFHDEQPREKTQGLPIPRQTTDAEGKFQLSSYAGTDGAPEGNYKVTVFIPEPPPATTGDSEEPSKQAPPRLDGRYADPATSGLSVTIKQGANKLQAFELK